MYIVVIFFTLLSIVVLKEVILYLRVKKRAVDLVALRLLNRFNYLIIIQISTLIWQVVIKRDIELFPFWILLFLFYGPYVLLAINHFLFKDEEGLLKVYFKDYYLSLFYFVSLSFFVFYFTENLRFINNYFYYAFVMLHLLFYGIKGFYLLKDKLSASENKDKREFKIIMYLSYLVGFVIVFSIIIFLFLTLFVDNHDVLFVFLTLTLIWIYVIINVFIYSIVSDKSELETIIYYSPENARESMLVEKINNFNISEDKVLYRNEKLELEEEYICSKYEKVRLSDDYLKQLDIKVRQVVLNEKAFLDPNFKISDLAIRVKVSRYYLSQYFTYIHNMNFREYINYLRIKDILENIENHNDRNEITANELFFQSAFNSKASFFKSFKSVTGMTPIEYIKIE